MKKVIKIFLASSITELKNERNELDVFIRDVSDKFEEQYEVKIQPIRCENVDPALSKGRKQQEYNELLSGCEMCFFIFFTKAGMYTIEEFEAAKDSFEKNDKPKIYTYFKEMPEKERDSAVKEFMNMLDKTLGHYYSVFECLDTIKLRILMNIKLQEMDYVQITVKDGMCQLDGQNVMSVERVAEFANSDILKQLREEYQETDRKYCQMKPMYAKQKSDSAFYRAYADVCAKRERLREQIEELEENILNMSLNLVRDEVRGVITERQREAFRLIELGDYDGSLAVLDKKELDSEYLRRKERQQEQAKKEAGVYIREHKTAIDVLAEMLNYKERFQEIRERYEAVFPEIKEYRTETDVLHSYVCFLIDQRDYEKGIDVAEEAVRIFEEIEAERNCDESKKDLAMSYNNLAILYSDTQRHDKAEEYYKRAIEIMERQTEWNREANEGDLADSYNNLALLFSNTQRHDQAEEYYKRAIEIRERQMERTKEAKEADLVICYNNLAAVYDDTQRYDEAEEYYKRTIEIIEKLTERDREANEKYLASSYNNLADLYSDIQHYSMAEEYYKRAIKIRERLTERNREANEADLAINYNNLAALYNDTQRYDEAEEYYKRTIEISERLTEGNREANEAGLAASYDNLAALYYGIQHYDQAEEYYKRGTEIRERLAERSREANEADLATSYNNLALLYEATQRYDKAEEYCKRAIKISERLTERNREANERDLGICYNNLALLYYDTQRYNKAEEYCKRAVEISERLMERNREANEADLARSYNNLAILYSDTQCYEKAEEYYKSAIEIRERLTERSREANEEDLINSYKYLELLYEEIQRFDEAEEYRKKMMEIDL